LGRIAKLAELSHEERKILFASVFMLPFVALLLRLLGYRKTRRFVLGQGAEALGVSAGQQLDRARRISRCVDAGACHGLYHANCLQRSLVLAWFLQRRRIPFDLRIGARNEPGENKEKKPFSAHAWVETQGEVLNDHQNVNERFKAFGAHFRGDV